MREQGSGKQVFGFLRFYRIWTRSPRVFHCEYLTEHEIAKTTMGSEILEATISFHLNYGLAGSFLVFMSFLSVE